MNFKNEITTQRLRFTTAWKDQTSVAEAYQREENLLQIDIDHLKIITTSIYEAQNKESGNVMAAVALALIKTNLIAVRVLTALMVNLAQAAGQSVNLPTEINILSKSEVFRKIYDDTQSALDTLEKSSKPNTLQIFVDRIDQPSVFEDLATNKTAEIFMDYASPNPIFVNSLSVSVSRTTSDKTFIPAIVEPSPSISYPAKPAIVKFPPKFTVDKQGKSNRVDSSKFTIPLNSKWKLTINPSELTSLQPQVNINDINVLIFTFNVKQVP